MLSDTDLLLQAHITIESYTAAAKRILDQTFAPGYAMKNPALVGQLVQAMTADFDTAMRVKYAYDTDPV